MGQNKGGAHELMTTTPHSCAVLCNMTLMLFFLGGLAGGGATFCVVSPHGSPAYMTSPTASSPIMASTSSPLSSPRVVRCCGSGSPLTPPRSSGQPIKLRPLRQ